MKTNYSEAWLKFKDSSDYRRAMTALFKKGILHPYSENILRGAFDAGWNATGIKVEVLSK